MRTVNRPADVPPELVNLANGGGEDFGPLARPLDAVFSGVCAYCERNAKDDDDDLNTRFFTCDHFKPRHLLCHRDPDVGECADRPPPHTADCPIYDWDNLVYACRSCADAKGGQWPRLGESADGYIDPTGNSHAADTVESVFVYDIGNGRVLVRNGTSGAVRNNAQRMIDDLALNDPRGPRNQGTPYAAKARRINLAELRRQWVKRLCETLDSISDNERDVLWYLVGEFIAPGQRFSSICRQFVQESEYCKYLTPASQ